MSRQKMKNNAARLLCVLLILAAVLPAFACGKPVISEESLVPVARGEGRWSFNLLVVDRDGGQNLYEIKTDELTVGDALVALGMITGTITDYGFWVETVTGIAADYDKDGVYWAFYIDGAYAVNSIDSTGVQEGTTFMLKVERG